MSRKDTILVAVIVNAGLLIVLFASALKSGSNEEVITKVHEPCVQELALLPPSEQAPQVVGDEVDTALAHYHKQELNTASSSENLFLNDLKTITQNESTLANPSVQTLMAPVVRPEQRLPQVVEVTVKKGDVLEKLARHHQSTVADIMRANQLKSTNLHIGQVLQIPKKTEAPSAPSSTAHPQGVYVVKKGDSVWTIAVKHKMKVEELLKMNQMTAEQAKKIQPGDKLYTSH